MRKTHVLMTLVLAAALVAPDLAAAQAVARPAPSSGSSSGSSGGSSGGSSSGGGSSSNAGGGSSGPSRSAPSGSERGTAVMRPTPSGSGSGGGSSASEAPRGDSRSNGGSTAVGRSRGNAPSFGTAVTRTNNGLYSGFKPIYFSYGFDGYLPWYSSGFGWGFGYYDPWSYNRWVFGRYGIWYNPYGYYDPYYGYSGGAGYYSGGDYSSPRSATGSIRFKVNPSVAKIYVDGTLMGVVDDFDGLGGHLVLDAGSHAIELRADGYETYTGTIKVEVGKTLTERINLKKSK